jgi:quercetin dioxygenase-like cupin family protein
VTVRRSTRTGLVVLFVVACGTSFAVGRGLQAPEPGRLQTSITRGSLRMLLDEAQLGGSQVSVGERAYPPNYASAEHAHKSIELIYVLSGRFQHVVNGKIHALTPGMLGVVKPGDKVQHRTDGSGPANVLMIWVPGDDGRDLARGWQSDR